jgi:hypothetical protein
MKKEDYHLSWFTPLYTGDTDLTIPALRQLKLKRSVTRDFIAGMIRNKAYSREERDILRKVLSKYPGKDIPARDFSEKVKGELLPLTAREVKPRYRNHTLPSNLRGKVSAYNEVVYESAISRMAGYASYRKKNTLEYIECRVPQGYFAHVRTEDMQDGMTRRIVELASDLYQGDGLKRENENILIRFEPSDDPRLAIREQGNKRLEELEKLERFSRSWPKRIIEEEIRRAAKDGKQRLLLPSGVTAAKAYSFDMDEAWITPESYERYFNTGDYNEFELLRERDLKPGMEVVQIGEGYENFFVVTEVLKDGKFKALKHNALEEHTANGKSLRGKTFDVEGTVPKYGEEYKLYDRLLGSYLENTRRAKIVKDEEDVKWREVSIRPEMAERPIFAFGLPFLSKNKDKDVGINEVPVFSDADTSPIHSNKQKELDSLKSVRGKYQEKDHDEIDKDLPEPAL